jgi:hypothetical protein
MEVCVYTAQMSKCCEMNRAGMYMKGWGCPRKQCGNALVDPLDKDSQSITGPLPHAQLNPQSH